MAKKMTLAQALEVIKAQEQTIEQLKAQLPSTDPNGRKLSMDKARIIRDLHSQGVSKNALSLKFQVSRDSIDAVLKQLIYKDGPLAGKVVATPVVAQKTTKTPTNGKAPKVTPAEPKNGKTPEAIKKEAHELAMRAVRVAAHRKTDTNGKINSTPEPEVKVFGSAPVVLEEVAIPA
jgi:lambda repressor-like predicted transcriptional regulator